jgi:hypothetical protein
MTEEHEVKLFRKLDSLRHLHQSLEEKIRASGFDEFSARRLKKEKLTVREQITNLENVLYPNIIA